MYNFYGRIFGKYRNYLKLSIIIAFYTAAMTYFSYERYLFFHAQTFDLGIKIQTIYTALNGYPIDNPNYVLSMGIFSRNYFAIHFSPIIYPISVFAHIFPTAIFLFFIQWGSIGLSSIFIYLISTEYGISHKNSLIISSLFLLYPPLLMSGMYDMHLLSFFPLATMWLYYSLSHKKYGSAALAFIFGFSIQESFLLLVPFVSAQILYNNHGFFGAFRFKKWGFIDIYSSTLAISSILLFILELKLMQTVEPLRSSLITSTNGYGVSILYLSDYVYSKLFYWFFCLGVLLFIPLIGYRKSIMIFPALILGFLSIHPGFTQLKFQYSLIFDGPIFLAFIEGLSTLKNVKRTTKYTKYQLILNMKRALRKYQTTLAKLSKDKLLLIIAIVVVILSPLSPLSLAEPYSRPIHVFSYVPNSKEFISEINKIPHNDTILASCLVFPYVATDPNAYPLLDKIVNGTCTYVYNFSRLFFPKFVLIIPSDYHIIKDIIPNFSSKYALLNTFNISVVNLLPLPNNPQNVSVLVYSIR